MGTPIVDTELAAILSKPEYRIMLLREASDREMLHVKHERRATLKQPSRTPAPYLEKIIAEFAQEAVDVAFGDARTPNLIDPIVVVELRAVDTDICLYRLYDGISHKTALTLGRWWCNRALLTQVCRATTDLTGKARRQRVLEFLRSAIFVHPSWNHGTNIAQMKIPAGSHVAAIIGRGSWEAMRSTTSSHDLKGSGSGKGVEIHTQEDVIDKTRDDAHSRPEANVLAARQWYVGQGYS